MKTVAFVPIKLNNERLKNKNILPLNNKPLCWYIFDSLKKVNHIDEIYVFCSNEDIKQYIPKDIRFLKRDKKLDDNLTKGLEIYHSFASLVDADVYVLAHATSPLIKSESIDESLNKVLFEEYDSALSVSRIQTFAWYHNKPINYKLDDIPRTQDLDPIYVETSAFFIYRKDVLLKMNRRIGNNPYLKEVDSIEAIDIDEEKDYLMAKRVLE